MKTAVLIGGVLRFIDKLNSTLFAHPPYHLFVSTDENSHICVMKKNIVMLNSTIEITPPFPKELKFTSSNYLHVVQWWRVQRAWWMMMKHEQNNNIMFEYIIKLRTDMKPHLFPISANGTKMRGDWFAWGPREAMKYHVSYLFTTYPRLVAYGIYQKEYSGLYDDRVYWPLPYAQMLFHGKNGLRGQLWKWLEFPIKSQNLTYGFDNLHSEETVLKHISKNLKNLSTLSMTCGPLSSKCISHKHFKLPPTIIPEAEKGLLYHTLSGMYVFENAMPAGHSIVGSSKKQSAIIPLRKSWKC